MSRSLEGGLDGTHWTAGQVVGWAPLGLVQGAWVSNWGCRVVLGGWGFGFVF